MSTEWDPDPETPHIEVLITKSGRMVGLKAGDAPGPQAYPFVQMIGVGTPVDLCQDIDIGDRLKAINGVFLKGKSRSEIHKLVRDIPENSEIKIKVIKSFKDKKFITDMGSSGFRVASVRRSNPLLSIRIPDEEDGGMGGIGEGEEEQADAQDDVIGEEEEDVVPSAARRTSLKSTGSFDGFGDDDDADAAAPAAAPPSKGFGGFKRKASVYGGFGDEAPSTADSTAVNTVDVDGEEFGFSEMSIGDDTWG